MSSFLYQLGHRGVAWLLEHVDRIELAGTPKWAVNNIIRRHEHLPLKLIAA
ncbi:hypothetical protein ABQF34_22225 [Mycolicibacterium boenickei]